MQINIKHKSQIYRQIGPKTCFWESCAVVIFGKKYIWLKKLRRILNTLDNLIVMLNLIAYLYEQVSKEPNPHILIFALYKYSLNGFESLESSISIKKQVVECE